MDDPFQFLYEIKPKKKEKDPEYLYLGLYPPQEEIEKETKIVIEL